MRAENDKSSKNDVNRYLIADENQEKSKFSDIVKVLHQDSDN